MIIPSKRFCDLCKNEIAEGQLFCALTYPIDQADRELFAGSKAGRELFPNIRQLLQFNANAAVSLEICRPCIDAILPMVSELKTDAIRRMVADRMRLVREWE